MEFDSFLVSDLKEFLLQYDITTSDIKGTGKNGNVLKKDLIRKAKKVYKSNIIYNDLPYDIIKEILLISDIETIRNICLTQKHFNLCYDYQFWKIIFNRDHLPLYEKQNSYIDYINVYKKISNVVKEVDIIFHIIEDFNIDYLTIKTATSTESFNLNNLNEFKKFLTKTLYLYPETEIYSGINHIPVRKEQLLTSKFNSSKKRLLYYKNDSLI